MTEQPYIELHASSAFSFLEGASQPEELAAQAAHLNMPAMALLDRDGVYGAARFHLAAKRVGIKAHIGAEVSTQYAVQNQFQVSSFKFQNLELRVSSFEFQILDCEFRVSRFEFQISGSRVQVSAASTHSPNF